MCVLVQNDLTTCHGSPERLAIDDLLYPGEHTPSELIRREVATVFLAAARCGDRSRRLINNYLPDFFGPRTARSVCASNCSGTVPVLANW